MNGINRVDFYADNIHYVDHLAQIWLALPADRRRFFIAPYRLVNHCEQLGIEPTPLSGFPPNKTRRGGPVVVAAWGNVLKWHRTGRKIIQLNHGSGQTFNVEHPSYAGGNHRGYIDAYLEPGPNAAEKIRRRTPHIPVFEIGCAKLDAWHRGERALPSNDRPVVCFSSHWDCRVQPETRSVWPEFGEAMLNLRHHFDVVAHAHPLTARVIRPAAEAAGIEFIEHFDEVLDRADVYVSGGSSTLYEFASTGRPVVVCNASYFRRDVAHGLLFWDAQPGVSCDSPDGLVDAVTTALADPTWAQNRRAHGLSRAYVACDGLAAQRGADAICELLERWP